MPRDAVTAPFVDVPLSTLHRFHEAASQELGDPLLGLNVGAALPLSTWDVMQLCCRSASNLGEALGRMPRLVRLLNAFIEINVTPGRDEWLITHRIPGEPQGLSRHGNELWVMTLLTQIRRVTGRPVRARRAWFGHRRPAEAAQVATLLGVPTVEFGAGSSGIALSAEDVKLPMASSDPVLLGVLDRLIDKALQQQGPRRGIGALAYQAVREQLNEKVPAIGAIARTLAISSRSFQRALAGEGTSYREVVDQVRRDLAAEHVAAGTPLGESAARLGYSSPGSLSRALFRWGAKP